MDRRRYGQLAHYFEPQRSSTQKARCLHQPRAARLFCLQGKPCPGISAQNGAQFPSGPSFGNNVPFWVRILGRAFRNGPPAESASHPGRQFRDAFSAAALATCRRRPGLHRAHRVPACGDGIRARRARRAPGGGAHAESARTGQPHRHRSCRQAGAPRPRCGHRCGRSLPRQKDARQSYRA